MGILGEIAKAVAGTAARAGVELVKAGYQVSKSTGEGVIKGTIKGTAAVAKEVVKKAAGS